MSYQQPHFLNDLLMRLSGSAAVAEPVSFRFMPVIRSQNDLWRGLSLSFVGAFKLWPSARADARPFSFRPPDGDLPSDLCQAAVFAIVFPLDKRGRKGPRSILERYTKRGLAKATRDIPTGSRSAFLSGSPIRTSQSATA